MNSIDIFSKVSKINYMNNNSPQSNETKIRMASALKNMLKNKNFRKITVGDIVSACNINRNTFYYHFENTYDLLYFAYEQEVHQITLSFRNANANVTQALEFILSYLDKNIELCRCAYESLGENELINIFEKDLGLLTNVTIDFICKQHNCDISEDFKSFLIFNFTNMLSSQIVWYIKYNEDLDKKKFQDYIYTTFFNSLVTSIKDGHEKSF